VDRSNQTDQSAYTAVKTQPYGQTFLVPTGEVPRYEALVESVFREYLPNTFLEKLLAQSIVNYRWRLRHTEQLEAGLYALGRRDLSPKYDDIPDAETRAGLIDGAVVEKFAKELKYLLRQRRFLASCLKKETAQLQELLKKNPKRRGLFLVPKRENLQ
jgi:hypothetical protein